MDQINLVIALVNSSILDPYEAKKLIQPALAVLTDDLSEALANRKQPASATPYKVWVIEKGETRIGYGREADAMAIVRQAAERDEAIVMREVVVNP